MAWTVAVAGMVMARMIAPALAMRRMVKVFMVVIVAVIAMTGRGSHDRPRS
jgi:hypothetical protein